MNDTPSSLSGDGHLTEETCLDVLSRALSRDALREIAAHLRACPACESLFRERSAEFEALRSRPGPARAGDGTLALDPTETEHATADGPDEHAPAVLPLSPRRFPSRVLAAGGALAAALLLVFLPRFVNTDAPYWIPVDTDQVLVRADTPASHELAEGLDAYAERDAARAAALLEKARVPPSLDPLRRLYWAGALTATGAFAEARDVLAPLDASRFPHPWDEEFRWQQFLVLEGTGDFGKAAALLDSLASRGGRIGDLARKRAAAFSRDSR